MFQEAFTILLDPSVLLNIFLGVISGICIGCLPGLTATMGVALVLPLTFGMSAANSILLLIGVYFGAIYGGSVSAILLNTPGTPASAATALDGHKMALKGEAGRALGIATSSSFVGGFISCVYLMLISPILARFALKFSSPEFFMLALFGLCIIASISGKSMAKGLLSGTFGILLATIGIDSITGTLRFTGGNVNLYSGINYIPVMIGLFAMSQAFVNIEGLSKKAVVNQKVTSIFPKKKDWKVILPYGLGFGTLGTFTGAIPGAGADIASFIAYGQAKNISKHSEDFGTGVPEAIVAPEAANNGVTGGALIPMLTLGVPGDAVAAIMIGALTVQGLQPGPLLFQNNGPMVYALFIGCFIANIIMFVVGINSVKLFTKVLSIPRSILIPTIFLLCVVGSYALSNSIFDVIVMFIFGIVGYFFHKLEIPASPAVLGLILGPMAESHFRRSLLMSQGSIATFFSSGISKFFLVLIIISLILPIFHQKFLKKTVNELKKNQYTDDTSNT